MKLNIKKLKINVIKCTTFKKRLLGFMFEKKLIKSGLLFEKCNSIHTFFMYQPIDIIMTDKENNIVYIKEAFKPNHIIWPIKKAYATYELPIGSINKLGI